MEVNWCDIGGICMVGGEFWRVVCVVLVVVELLVGVLFRFW